MRPSRIRRMWKHAKGFGTDAQTTQTICGELLGILDEASRDPDVGRVYIRRGHSYCRQSRREEALADFSSAADFFLRQEDLIGILDAEEGMLLVNVGSLEDEARRTKGSVKGLHLERVRRRGFVPRDWTYSSEGVTQVEKLFSYLGDPDPDVRAYADLAIRFVGFSAREAKEWLIDYYRQCLASDDDRAALVGRHVGGLLLMGPDDVYPADMTFLKFGKDVPRSFVNCACAHCGYLNRGVPVPPAGAVTPYYSSVGRQGKCSVLALCARCNREFFLAWDTDPRS